MFIYYLSWPKMSPVAVYLSYAPHAATSCSLGCLTVQNQEGLCLKSCLIQLPLARFVLLPLHGHVICNNWPKMLPGTSGMTQKATVEVGLVPPPGEKKLCLYEWLCVSYPWVLGPLANIWGLTWGLHCLCERTLLMWSALPSCWVRPLVITHTF